MDDDHEPVRPSTTESYARRYRPHLLNLPHELQTQILAHLSLSDLQTLRETTPLYHNLITPSLIRSLFTPIALTLQTESVCGRCFFQGPSATLLDDDSTFKDAFKARCLPCVAEDEGFEHRLHSVVTRTAPNGRLFHQNHHGVEVQGRTWTECSFCLWCARPTWCRSIFHTECRYWHYDSVRAWRWLAAFRTVLLLVTVSLALHYYHKRIIVLVPSIFTFVVLSLLACFTALRGKGTRRRGIRAYHCTGVLEAMLLVLFIPPTYFFATHLNQGKPKGMTLALLVLYSTNILIRLLNTLGNIALYMECNPINAHRKIPRWRKLLCYVQFALCLWSAPSFLQNYIPRRPHPPLDPANEELMVRRLAGVDWWVEFKHVMSRHRSDIDY